MTTEVAETGAPDGTLSYEEEVLQQNLSDRDFATFDLEPSLMEAITDMGFTRATEVQAAVLESLHLTDDLLVQARTGTGKTAAYGLVMAHHLEKGAGSSKQPAAIVLAPTRELAVQVTQELERVGGKKGLRMVSIYGGVPINRQITQLAAGVDIVVGTPGRVEDHLRRGTMDLSKARFACLDEADEMLSMGFWESVTAILDRVPKQRRILLFSATLPYEVAKSVERYLSNPVRIDVSQDEMTVSGIDHFYLETVAELPKPRQLLYLLEQEQPRSAIIFCNTRSETEVLAKYLVQAGFMAEALSGKFSQADRERVMARIKEGNLKYMVATDIVSRGIDISHLSHVVNYALPEYPEVYLHRVGRTGRSGRSGVALSLLDGRSLASMSKLRNEFGIEFQTMELMEESKILARRRKRMITELSDKASVAEVGQHIDTAKGILEADDGAQLIAFLLKSYYNTEANREVRKSRPKRDQDEGRDEARSEARADQGGDEGGEPRKRSRSRRRRRGRGGDRERSEGGQRGEVVDAADLLAGSSSGGSPSDSTASTTPAGEVPEGHQRVRVNVGFNDGFKGRGAVAKKITDLAGLNDGNLKEIESKRDYSILQGSKDTISLLLERVDGAQIGKKVVSVATEGDS